MHIIARIAATGLLISAGSAEATLTASLKAGPVNALGTSEGVGALYTIPATGARFDLSVTLDRLASDPAVQDGLMRFVSDGNGAAILNQAINFGSPSSTSTRFMVDWWDGDHCAIPRQKSLNASPSDFYACHYFPNDGFWSGPGAQNPLHSHVGFVNVTVGSTSVERTFTITPVNVAAVDANFNDVFGQGLAVTIHQLPEPGSALLLFSLLPFLRRRNTL